MELTLTQLFGEGASQTTTSLIIKKSALLNLTISSNNRAEQLLAAIIFYGSQQFMGTVTSELGMPITSTTGEILTYDNTEYYDLLNIQQWKTLVTDDKIKHTFIINQFQVYAD
ncbi:MAG: hypothetical protein KME54_23275 [Tolypothrix brevis GSE-NOS-MK-07-07A]|jgi:hypothetical protein|nr:hypothetical protein [Tolypothrix brevis GSE-NOS-MK-07-07A]